MTERKAAAHNKAYKNKRHLKALERHPFFGGCPRCRHLFWCSANRRCDRLPCEIGELPVEEED